MRTKPNEIETKLIKFLKRLGVGIEMGSNILAALEVNEDEDDPKTQENVRTMHDWLTEHPEATAIEILRQVNIINPSDEE